MIQNPSNARKYSRFLPSQIDNLFAALQRDGYKIIGPTVAEGVIVFREISCPKALPRGWRETQGAGHYSLKQLESSSNPAGPYFAHHNGPDSARAWFLPQKQKLWSAERHPETPSDYSIFFPPEKAQHRDTKLAFIGLRACDLNAIAIQDRVYLHDKYTQTNYAAGRENTLIVTINCISHAETCFCTSMQAGPEAKSGFDLALTEIYESDADHYFVAKSGSAAGQSLLNELTTQAASANDIKTAKDKIAANEKAMPKHDFSGIPAAMKHQPDHPAWDTIADHCLACANCTLVCPTCFCTTVEDTTDLTGNTTERWLHWDSCFNEGHSYIHGGKIHGDISSRYRQWASHKFSSWHDQFGESGCVGCGRCIAWCPAGIDIRETAQHFITPAETSDAVVHNHGSNQKGK
jgi:formate hydrogenlyase subunit 6/NADH:ubiquinone oxidoreductase subunit I